MTEKKSWLDVILMPLVVAFVGGLGTYLITQQQEMNAIERSKAQIQSAVQLADADRQVKILEIFAAKITDPDPGSRIMALRMLRVLNKDLAEQLSEAVKGVETDSGVKAIASKIVEESRRRYYLGRNVEIAIHGDIEQGEMKYEVKALGSIITKGLFTHSYTNENGQVEDDNFSAEFILPPGAGDMIWNPTGKRVRIRVLKQNRKKSTFFYRKGDCIYEECSLRISGETYGCSSWINLGKI